MVFFLSNFQILDLGILLMWPCTVSQYQPGGTSAFLRMRYVFAPVSNRLVIKGVLHPQPPTPIMNSCELLRICFASLPTWWMTWAQHANPGALEVKFHGCFFAFCPCPLLQHQLNSIIRHHHDKGHLHPPSCTVNALSQRLKTRNKIALGRAGFLIQCTLQKPRNIFHLELKWWHDVFLASAWNPSLQRMQRSDW